MENREFLITELTKIGIPVHEIEESMWQILYSLNIDLGLKTAFCCDGHGEQFLYIMFDLDVLDKDMFNLMVPMSRVVGTTDVSKRCSWDVSKQFSMAYGKTKICWMLKARRTFETGEEAAKILENVLLKVVAGEGERDE